MSRMNMRWVGQELDDEGVRKRFRRALMRARANFNRSGRKLGAASIFTPYWKSDFIDWLVFEGTLNPCGARVESITPDFVTFGVDCSGVQTEGVCLDATFVIPASEFTGPQLMQMVHDFGHYPCGEKLIYETGNPSPVAKVITYGPFDNTEYITELEWWYDGSYDERGSDGSE